jgi:hypothetical protein
MTIVVLNTDPAIRIPVQRMLDRAHRRDPDLTRTSTDLAILASIGPTGPLAPAPDDAALVVVTARPSPAQAAAALLLGARAYLPLDLPPDRRGLTPLFWSHINPYGRGSAWTWIPGWTSARLLDGDAGQPGCSRWWLVGDAGPRCGHGGQQSAGGGGVRPRRSRPAP